MLEQRELIAHGLAWLGLALLVAWPLAVWHGRATTTDSMPPRQLPLSWGGAEVLLGFLAWQVLLGLAAQALHPWLGNADTVHLELWAVALSFPVMLLGVPALMFYSSGTRPCELGLSLNEFAADYRLGVAWWLVLTPLVLAIHLATNAVYWHLTGQPPSEHPLTHGLQNASAPLTLWLMTLMVAVLMAPVLEELLFRGLLWPWLRDRPHGPAIGLAAAVGCTVVLRPDAASWGPVIVALLPIPLALALPAISRFVNRPETGLSAPAARALVANASVFAAVHAMVWPTPVPLFVLGLGLAWLRHRTDRLTAPIVLHALFNGTSCVALVLLRGL